MNKLISFFWSVKTAVNLGQFIPKAPEAILGVHLPFMYTTVLIVFMIIIVIRNEQTAY